MSLVDVFSVVVETMVEDVPCGFHLDYRRTAGGPATFPALDLVNVFVANVAAHLKGILSSTVQIMRVIGRPLDPATGGNPYEANFDETNVGTAGAEPLPPSLAALFKLTTTSLNSRNNGHIYIAGIPENVWVNGAWTAGFGVNAALFADDIDSALPASAAGVTYQPCVVSRLLANVPRVPPITFDVIGVDLSPRISQQRRRMSGQQGIRT